MCKKLGLTLELADRGVNGLVVKAINPQGVVGKDGYVLYAVNLRN